MEDLKISGFRLLILKTFVNGRRDAVVPGVSCLSLRWTDEALADDARPAPVSWLCPCSGQTKTSFVNGRWKAALSGVSSGVAQTKRWVVTRGLLRCRGYVYLASCRLSSVLLSI